MKKANGWRVEPAPTCAWRRISVSPTTEISAGFLERELPDVAQAGNGEAQRLRHDDPAEHQPARHADRARGLELAAGDRLIRAAEDLALIGAGDDADGDRAGGERIDADEPGRPARCASAVSAALPPK